MQDFFRIPIGFDITHILGLVRSFILFLQFSAYNIATGNAALTEEQPPVPEDEKRACQKRRRDLAEDERRACQKRRRDLKQQRNQNRVIEEGPMSHEDYVAKRRQIQPKFKSF
jgi:hypothetical protein